MKNILEFNINEKSDLLEYLLSNVKNKSKNNIKALLKNGFIYVNGINTTKFDYKLNKGDKVTIKLFHTYLDILYEDNDLVIVNKEYGLLTVGTEKDRENTLYRKVSDYVKQNNSHNKIFIVNRLDKDTSGIVVFAKNEGVKSKLQARWNDIVTIRKYIAVVEGSTLESGTIKSYLDENKEHMVYSAPKGLLAITKYKKIKCNKKYSMLEVNLLTGRKNQIRVHMKDIDHIVVGDKKYGSKINPINRLMLHACELEFKLDNKVINIKCDYPKVFDKLF